MKQKAIFLDRDGVLIKNDTQYYIWKLEKLEFTDGVFDNLRLLSQQGYRLFIVSNQGGISKGIYKTEDVIKFHSELESRFKNEGIQFEEIVFCPHHPEIEKCMCRKPESLMIDKLVAKYKLSYADSFLIGDTESDMQAAQKAGIQGIKVIANQNMYPFISFLQK
jgi:D-glycero-D-manno-heptose 1,7-bisphosphate phosphatase